MHEVESINSPRNAVSAIPPPNVTPLAHQQAGRQLTGMLRPHHFRHENGVGQWRFVDSVVRCPNARVAHSETTGRHNQGYQVHCAVRFEADKMRKAGNECCIFVGGAECVVDSG